MASIAFCSFLFFLHCLSFTSSHASDNETDLLSLLSFKNHITNDPFQVMRSWNDSLSFCQWKGITCSLRPPRVTILSLPSQKLGGYLSPHIANLTFLQTIDLSGNNFKGKIPPEIGRLFRQSYLFLMENYLGGEIPSNLSQCISLKSINLNRNSLTGKIPTELTTLPNLVALHISANHLTGGIPPALGNISSLLNLSIAQNYLGGTIPENLGRLINLQFLQVGSNNLSGTIPTSTFNLSRMSIFATAFNNLTGTFPWSLGTNFPNLKQLLVGVNHFSGSIPQSLSNASALQIIDLPDNRFSGRVPENFGWIKNLRRLNVGRNLLGGELGFIESLVNCSRFEMLGIDSNDFSGALPQTVANLSTTMNSLLLGCNQLSGRIPSGITNLINLNTLNVSWNEFDGPISPDIGKLVNLRQLYMNGNRFAGKIPFSLGNLTKLFELRLDENSLESEIPSSLGSCQQLQLLNISGNNLIGHIPLQLFGLSSLTISLNLARNSLSGILPVNFGSFSNLKELDLSYNRFSGSIPEGIGRCLSLEHVYMHDNSLNGSIPLALSALKGIQDLDLSKNNLTGSIPEFLQDFVFLRYLNLSFNHLKSEVPRNGIFKNESAVSLHGNNELCGGNVKLHLPVCDRVGDLGKPSYIKVVIGTVCGVLGSVVVLYVVFTYIVKRSRAKGLITFPLSDWNSDFSYRELEKATNGFPTDSLVGMGSFASVYKGSLSEDGNEIPIAVKVLKIQEKRISKIYVAECEVLSNIRHRNLVSVLGCCSDMDSEGRDFKAIVLEFMPNGSLDKWLHEKDREYSLDLFQRLSIAIDVASALEYLHCYCHVPVAHCDIKPGNVLLDKDMFGHLSDFGLAKFPRKHAESSSVGIRGSIGYVAPEYGMGGPASAYGDVYSFGILVLEMFTGKRPTDDLFRNGLCLHTYAKTALMSNKMIDIVDPTLFPMKQDGEDVEDGEETAMDINRSIIVLEENVKQCLALIIRIGVACSQELPHDRMHVKDANLNLQLIRDALSKN